MLKSELFSTRLSSFSPRARTLSMVLCYNTEQNFSFKETETSIITARVSSCFCVFQKKLNSLIEEHIIFGQHLCIIGHSVCMFTGNLEKRFYKDGPDSGDCTYKDNLCLIQLPLDFQQLISLCWVLKITNTGNHKVNLRSNHPKSTMNLVIKQYS